MSKTISKMVELGKLAPSFELIDVSSNKNVKLEDKKKYIATVVMFLCNHCPYVKHINSELSNLAKKYLEKNIRFLAISSNDASTYPEDSPSKMILVAKDQDYPFPYLYDETQEVAKAYGAACTPDFFVFDKILSLVYRGQFDDSRPENHIKVTGESVSTVLDCLLNDKPITLTQKPSMGCNIKWKISEKD